jgi:hypothetical protein
MKWFDFSERLPEEGQLCLCKVCYYGGRYEIDVAKYIGGYRHSFCVYVEDGGTDIRAREYYDFWTTLDELDRFLDSRFKSRLQNQ